MRAAFDAWRKRKLTYPTFLPFRSHASNICCRAIRVVCSRYSDTQTRCSLQRSIAHVVDSRIVPGKRHFVVLPVSDECGAQMGRSTKDVQCLNDEFDQHDVCDQVRRRAESVAHHRRGQPSCVSLRMLTGVVEIGWPLNVTLSGVPLHRIDGRLSPQGRNLSAVSSRSARNEQGCTAFLNGAGEELRTEMRPLRSHRRCRRGYGCPRGGSASRDRGVRRFPPRTWCPAAGNPCSGSACADARALSPPPVRRTITFRACNSLIGEKILRVHCVPEISRRGKFRRRRLDFELAREPCSFTGERTRIEGAAARSAAEVSSICWSRPS